MWRLLPLMCCFLVLDTGCSGRPVSPRVGAPAASQIAMNPAVPPALQAVMGLWEVDVDATMRENCLLPENFREAMYQNITKYPFTLEITDRTYVSRSIAQTRADTYDDWRVEGDVVILDLHSANDSKGSPPRQARLRIRDGKLIFAGENLTKVVFTRLKPSQK